MIKTPPISFMTGLPRRSFLGKEVPLYRNNLPSFQTWGFPWGEEHPWGLIKLAKNVVTIAAGEFSAGNGTSLATPQTTFSAITSDASYIGLQYNLVADTLILVGPTTAKPVPGSGVWQTWLYFFAYNATTGYATFVKHNLTGNWHAALFAQTTS